MAGIVFPNLAATLGPLIQMDRQNELANEDRQIRREHMAWERDRADEDRKLRRETFDFQRMKALDDQQRTKIKETADWAAHAAMGVLSVPPEQRAAAYQAALADGHQRGFDVSKLPPQYSPSVEGQLNFYASRARDINKWFEQEGNRPTPMVMPGAPPAGGGPMPGGGGGYSPSAFMQGRVKRGDDPMTAAAWAANVEHESSFNPVAYNPKDPNGGSHGLIQWNGPRAQALRQFAASRGANPADPEVQQDFLQSEIDADPQFKAALAAAPTVQEKAALISMRFIRPAGGQPEAMSRGQTATKYAQAGGVPVIPQGDAIPPSTPGPQGDVMAQVRGVQLPPGARIMAQKGIPIVKDGTVMILKADGTPDFVPLPQRKDPMAGGGIFPGNSVEANALNQLIARGILSEQQALDLAAGKTITDPSTGQIIFKRPTELVGGAATPAPTQGGGTVPSAPTGGVPLTPAKKEPALKKLETEIRAVESSIDNFQKVITEAGGGSWRALINDPTSAEAQKVLGAYNAMKTALRSEAFINTGVLQPAEMKMLDDMLLSPTSVRGYLATPEGYAAMLDQIRTFVKGKMDAAGVAYGQTPPKAAAPAQPAAPPKTGDVQDGYLFKGGDPSKPESWEKVR